LRVSTQHPRNYTCQDAAKNKQKAKKKVEGGQTFGTRLHWSNSENWWEILRQDGASNVTTAMLVLFQFSQRILYKLLLLLSFFLFTVGIVNNGSILG
jgi:hypothetical protein